MAIPISKSRMKLIKAAASKGHLVPNSVVVDLLAEIERLEASLHHIGYQLPEDSISLDWHQEWRNLRLEARHALGEDK